MSSLEEREIRGFRRGAGAGARQDEGRPGVRRDFQKSCNLVSCSCRVVGFRETGLQASVSGSMQALNIANQDPIS